jgi:hypothetical protein
MMKRAKEYIEGDREQMEIFKDVNNEEEETHEAEEA